ncbi:unnamed protein product [Candida verbasci]|uniref:Ribosomal protein/NADH dehydrogenase domain-containing protein n=1 Tax=Candida verbasci TaxID=1227364 RepID=A0A9W4U2D4_9ASCO|nr:unnamed protein product [Candida verbasci]
MSLKPIITKTGKYNSTIRKQIIKLNNLTGTKETAFKFNPSFSKFEMWIYLQNSIPHPPSNGLKQFFVDYLPTLRFHNPDFEYKINTIMNVESESQLNKIPLKLKLSGDDTVEIDCKGKSGSDILKELTEKGKLMPVSEEDIPKIPLNPDTKENRYLK